MITEDDSKSLPVTTDSAEVLPVPGGAGILVKGIYDVIIHSGPGLSYGTLAALPAYTTAQATARTQDNDWVKVNYQGTTGWVAAWVVTATGDYTNLPVEPSNQ